LSVIDIIRKVIYLLPWIGSPICGQKWIACLNQPFGTFSRSPAPLSRWNAAVDVYQDKDQFTVVVELPGLKKEEIEISLHDDTLTISGERKREESSEQEFLTERSYGKFQRSLTLPSAVDAEAVKANYKNGLLQVVLPKAEQTKPKQIEVDLK
jgi:HSP20 family protein